MTIYELTYVSSLKLYDNDVIAENLNILLIIILYT